MKKLPHTPRRGYKYKKGKGVVEKKRGPIQGIACIPMARFLLNAKPHPMIALIITMIAMSVAPHLRTPKLPTDAKQCIYAVINIKIDGHAYVAAPARITLVTLVTYPRHQLGKQPERSSCVGELPASPTP
jgi:hypothetical protein